MAFFKNKNTETSGDPFLDALISISTNDTSTYVGLNSLHNSDVFSAINVIAGNIASSTIEADQHYLNKMLNIQPNGKNSAFSFWFCLIANLLLNGNSFAEIKPDKTLEIIPNNKMTVNYDDVSNTVTYNYGSNGSKMRQIAPDNILHFKVFSINGVSGISPLTSLNDELKIQKYGNRLLSGFFKSPSTGVLKVNKSDLSSDAKANIRDKFQSAMSDGYGLMVMDSSMDYDQIKIDQNILKLVNSNNWSTNKISSVFGIPSELLGVENEHSSVSQSLREMLMLGLSTYLNAITSELTLKFGEHGFKFDTQNIMPASPQENFNNTITAVNNGILTINEARGKLNLEPVKDGDTILASLNYTPLNNLENYQKNKGVEENGTQTND